MTSLRALLAKRQPAWVGYTVALLGVGLAVGLKLSLEPMVEREIAPFSVFMLAIVIGSWYGWGPGFLALALSTFIGEYFFVGPSNSLEISTRNDAIRLSFFVGQGAAVVALGAAARHAFDSRGRIVEEERAAHAKTETLAERLLLLQRITADLAGSRTQRDVARVIVEQAMPALGAHMGSLVLLDKKRKIFQTLVRVGHQGDVLDHGVEFPLGVSTPFADAVTSKQAVVLTSRAERDARYPMLVDEPANSGEALVALPLLVDGRATGAVGFSFPAARQFTDDEIGLLALLSDQCAQALERARLYEEQQAEHRELGRGFTELSALYDLIDGAVRAESLDEIYDQTLLAIKRSLGTDRAALLLFDAEGVMSFVASEGLSEEYRAAVNGHSPWPRDAHSPKPVLVRNAIADASLEHLHEVSRKEGVRGIAFIPLTYHGRLLGTCMLYYDQPHEFTDAEVQVAGIIANKTSISIERKRAEEALAHSELRYRSLFDRNYDAVFSFDLNGRFTSLNAKVEEISGYTREELMGAPYELLVLPERLEETLSGFLRVVQGEQQMLDTTIRHKDGRRIDVDVTGIPIVKDDTIEGVYGIARDVTEQKRMQEALREGEERYRTLFESIDEGFCVIEKVEGGASDPLDFRYVEANPAFAVHAGVADVVGKTIREAFPGEPEEWFETYDRIVTTGEPKNFERGLVTQGRVLELYAFRVEDETRRRVAVIFKDITARKQAEEALQGTLRKLSVQQRRTDDLVSNVPGVVWEAWGQPDLASQRIDFVSDYVEEMLGYSVDEWLSTPNFWLSIVHPDDKERAAAEAAAIYASRVGGQSQFRWIGKTGRVVHVDAHSNVITDESGNPIGMRGVTIDVSQSKRAEERFTSAFQASPAAISITRGRDRVILDVNDSFCDVTGYRKDELVGRPVEEIALWATQDEQQKFAGAIASEGRVRGMETQIREKGGEIKQTLGSAEVINIDGEDCVLALFYDITERKRFERRLRDSEERFRSLAEASTSIIWRTDERGAFDLPQPGWAAYTGQSWEEYREFGWSNALHPEDKERVLALWDMAITAKKLYESDGRVWHAATRSYRFFHARATPLLQEDGSVREWIGSCEDVTERKEAEDRLVFLAEASERLAGSLDYITVLRELAAIAVPALADWCAVDVVEDGGAVKRLVVTHADPAKGEIARLLEQRHIRNVEDMPTAIELLSKGQSMLNPDLTEEDLVASALDETHLEIMHELGFRSAMIVPILTRDRLVGAMTLVASAESGRRYNQSDLAFAEEIARRAALSVENARLFTESQKSQAELRMINEQKDEFLGMVSHELRTPITIIYGASSVLRNRGATFDDESRQELLADIDRESHRLRRLVDDMMILARMELEHSNGAREPVNVERTIDRILRELKQRNPSQRTEVHVEGRLPPVSAEPTYLEQILRNLITNAFKYAPNKPIEVHAHRNGGAEAIVSVMDRGPGLRPEEMEQVFERFYRSDQVGSVGGTGMGLTVCKRLVEAQSGKIWAEAREGGGLIVNFSLPIYSGEN